MDANYQKSAFTESNEGRTQFSRPSNHSRSNLVQFLNNLNQAQGGHSPLLSLIITVAGIAIANLIAMIFVYYLSDLPYYLLVLLDGTIMTVIVLPLLYFLSLRPLLLQIQQRQQSESILQARLRLMQYANTHTMDELLQLSLDEIEILTCSTVSFFHFIEADQKTIRLNAWSTNTLQNMCKAESEDIHSDLEYAGVWADAVRQLKPIIHNNFEALAGRKGFPEGHVQLIRELVIPIQRDNKVVAILGLGNKPQDFTANDVEVVSIFADFAWDIVEHKRIENDIQKSEQKFRTLVDWTYEWEQWLDPDSNIVYNSPSCERISGYTPDEFISDPNLLIRIVHPDDRQFYEEHLKINHDVSAGPTRIEYRIITCEGSEHWIEHICRPLFGSDGKHLGRRISNRDITEQKQAEKVILEQNQKESILTRTIHTLQADFGRDLHDTLGQNISFLRMNLEHLSEAQWSDPTDIKTQIQNLNNAANESYEMIRTMLAILQTENLNDPLSLFTRYADQIAERSSFHSDITNQGQPKQLSVYQIRQLFYIFREAIGNVEKYANAKQVSGEFIWGDHDLKMVISDDGTGFDPSAIQTSCHYGLKYMRERAEQMKGSFYIRSIPGRGTTITVVVPYESESIIQS